MLSSLQQDCTWQTHVLLALDDDLECSMAFDEEKKRRLLVASECELALDYDQVSASQELQQALRYCCE
jgi:uncharacterized protein YfcZ (UPF0381/DUF406 family)